MTPRQMCTAFIENEGGDDDLVHPSIFVHPAWSEYARRLKMLPRLAAQAAWRLALGGASGVEAIKRLGRALPTGVFSNAPIEAHLRAVFSAPGSSRGRRDARRRRAAWHRAASAARSGAWRACSTNSSRP